MSIGKFYRPECPKCPIERPTLRIYAYGFDDEGNLHIRAVCNLCLSQVNVKHDATEIMQNIKDAMQEAEPEHQEMIEELRNELENLDQMGFFDEEDE